MASLGLAWLREDLGRIPLDRPIVVLFHRTVKGYLEEDWPDRHRGNFLGTLAGRDVRAILTGHWHDPGSMEWQGYLIVRPGGVRHGACNLMVVRVTNGQVRISLFDWGAWEAGLPPEDCWWSDVSLQKAMASGTP